MTKLGRAIAALSALGFVAFCTVMSGYDNSGADRQSAEGGGPSAAEVSDTAKVAPLEGYIYPSPDPDEVPLWFHPDAKGPWHRVWSSDRKEIAMLETAAGRVVSSCRELSAQQYHFEVVEIATADPTWTGHDYDRYGWKGNRLSVMFRSFDGTGYPVTIVAGQGKRPGAVVIGGMFKQQCPDFMPIPGLRLPQEAELTAAERRGLDSSIYPFGEGPPIPSR